MRVALLLAVGALVGSQLLPSSSGTAASPSHAHRAPHRDALGEPASGAVRGSEPGAPGAPDGGLSDSEARGALDQADGAVPDGTTVFAGEIPGVANLDPDLLAALRQAATDAEGVGIELLVDSGWRSLAYQEHLLQDAVAQYGSVEEAARWVATPKTSAHVSGDAIDIGPSDATAWLSANGGAYGLCQVYGNEPWHYELRPEAVTQGCPAMYADPTQDPRMQQ